jgi:hypothetical protein
MMTISSRIAAASVAFLLLGGTVLAQTPAPAPAPAAKKMEKPRTAASLECSKEADAKTLHGKDRKKFMRECKKEAKAKAAPAK